MAKRTEGKIPKQVIVQQLDIRQVVRNTIDIDKWRQAHKQAENPMRPNRVALYDIYEDMIIDGRLSSAIEKRKRAVTNTQITFTNDGEINEKIMPLINSPWFSDMLGDILDSRFWGHTLLEFTEFLPDKTSYTLVPRKHVIPSKGIVVKSQSDTEGFPYRELPWDNFTLEAGKPNDLGLILKTAPYVIFKRNGFGDYAQFCEIFGIPMRIGRYDLYDEEGRKQLQAALDQSGSALSLTVPKGSEVEIKETGNTQGANTLFSTLIALCNTEISIIILGQTLTTEQGDKGARSLGEVHMDVEEQVHMDDRQYIKNWLNYEYKWLLEQHGYNPGDGEFDFVDPDNIDLSKQIEIDKAAVEMGIPLSDDYFYDRYGWPKPENYEALKAEMKAKKQPAAPIQNQPPSDPPTKKPADTPVKMMNFFNHMKSFFQRAPR